jgi:hypothetical protein
VSLRELRKIKERLCLLGNRIERSQKHFSRTKEKHKFWEKKRKPRRGKEKRRNNSVSF